MRCAETGGRGRAIWSMNIRHRAYAYITNGRRLLLITHPESPDAGVQVPAGTIEPGESPKYAVMREAREETGLAGAQVREAPRTGHPRHAGLRAR